MFYSQDKLCFFCGVIKNYESLSETVNGTIRLELFVSRSYRLILVLFSLVVGACIFWRSVITTRPFLESLS